VLIIDEALSVGDGYFQKKCMDRIRALLDDGCTFLFCSHAMYYVSTFCDRALWLQGGRAESLGDVSRVVREYESWLLTRRHRAELEDREQKILEEGGPREHNPARLVSARLLNGEKDGTFQQGGSWGIEIEWRSEKPELVFQVGVGVNRGDGVQVCSFLTTRSELEPMTGREHYRVRLHVPALPIHRGEFEIYVFLADEVGLHVYDQIHMPDAFTVDSDDYDYGLIQVDHYWEPESSGLPERMPAESVAS
jgi:lipopolysaccharide transport system ATP-binding protein